MDTLAANRRAYFDYDILEEYEAGIALAGHEAKAVKARRMTLAGAFAVIRNNEAYLLNAAIAPYQAANTPKEYEPSHTRKLLLHAAEIKELIGKTSQQGLTIVPLKVYNKRGRIKILIALARHRKKFDKREVIKKRETDREMERVIK